MCVCMYICICMYVCIDLQYRAWSREVPNMCYYTGVVGIYIYIYIYIYTYIESHTLARSHACLWHILNVYIQIYFWLTLCVRQDAGSLAAACCCSLTCIHIHTYNIYMYTHIIYICTHTHIQHISDSHCVCDRMQAISQLRAVARSHTPCVSAFVVLARLQEVSIYVCVYIYVYIYI